MTRVDQLERYRALPLPTTTDESWRFTDLKGFDPEAFSADGATEVVAAPAMLDLEAAGLVRVSEAGLEIDRAPDGIRFERLDEHPRLGELVGTDEKFAAHNAAEWEHAGFGGQAVTLFGLFDGESLVAAANLSPGPGGASDVGVLTRPDVRGKGYGERVAALAAAQAVAMCGIARYRVPVDFEASLSIARRLGFAEYGRNLVINLS